MHYSVCFTGSNRACEAQALAECRDYLGDRFPRVCASLGEILAPISSPRDALRATWLACDFIGIRGRWPCRAMLRAALKAREGA